MSKVTIIIWDHDDGSVSIKAAGDVEPKDGAYSPAQRLAAEGYSFILQLLDTTAADAPKIIVPGAVPTKH